MNIFSRFRTDICLKKSLLEKVSTFLLNVVEIGYVVKVDILSK